MELRAQIAKFKFITCSQDDTSILSDLEWKTVPAYFDIDTYRLAGLLLWMWRLYANGCPSSNLFVFVNFQNSAIAN